MRADFDLTLCGWRVRSDLDIPELARWPGGQSSTADLSITCGPLKNSAFADLTDFRQVCALTGAYGDGTWSLAVPGVGTFLVRDGNAIHIARAETATDGDLRTFLLGPVLAVCCAQRNLLPLRATVLRTRQGAIAICGDAGVGKSAVSLTLTNGDYGYELISDGLAICEWVPDKALVRSLTTFPAIHLWRRAIFSLDLSLEGMSQMRPCLEKYSYRCEDRFTLNHSEVLRHIVILGRATNDEAAATYSNDPEQRLEELKRCIAVGHRNFAETSRTQMMCQLHHIVSSVVTHRISMTDDAAAALVIRELMQ